MIVEGDDLPLDVDPHRPHQRQSVAVLHHTLLQPVIKLHFAVFHMVCKVNIARTAVEGGRGEKRAIDNVAMRAGMAPVF